MTDGDDRELTQPIALALYPSTVRALQAYATSHGLSRSAATRQLLMKALMDELGGD